MCFGWVGIEGVGVGVNVDVVLLVGDNVVDLMSYFGEVVYN